MGCRAQLGINPFDFSWKLEPGAEFQTPEAVLVFSPEGLGGMSRAYHRLYRKRLCRGEWRDKPRPILVNNWEATYFDFGAARLEKIAVAAADLGIELRPPGIGRRFIPEPLRSNLRQSTVERLIKEMP